MGKENKTSLQKSHSAWSNTKLTTLCVITVIAVSALWLAVGLFTKLQSLVNTAVAIVAIAVPAALTILCMLGISKFTR